MLELRPICERCETPLPPESPDARICSYECTWCVTCADGPLAGVCPNCGGNLQARPIRPAEQLPGKPPLHLKMRADRGLVYGQIDGFRPLELDLYRPGPGVAGPYPLLVFVHGGGWRVSSRHQGPRETRAWKKGIFERFVDAGFAVAAIEYRFSGEAPYPAAVDDVCAATRWLRDQASEYGLDADRFVVWGQSAGGYLAAMIGLATDVGPIRAVSLWYPVTDFPSLVHDGVLGSYEAMFLGHEIGADPDHSRAASATSRARADAPPFRLHHGTADTMAPYQQSVALHAALAEAGANVELVTIEGADHFFVGSDQVEQIFADTVAFLRSHC